MKFALRLICAISVVVLVLPCFSVEDEDWVIGDIRTIRDEEVKAEAELYAMFMHAANLEESDVKEAEKIYLVVIARDPGAAYVYYKLGRLYWREGDTEKSVENFERAIEKNPYLKEAYVDYALIRRINGDNQAAIEIYETAVENVKDNLDLYKVLADTYVLENEAEKAFETWKRATKEHPRKADPWINAIKMSLALGNQTDADALYEEALVQTEGSNRLLEGVRRVYSRSRNEDKADEITLKLIEKRPISTRYRLDHIAYFLNKGEVLEAKKAYDEAAEYLQHRSDFFLSAGRLFVDQDELESASLIFQQGLKVKPSDSDLLLALASLYEKQGETEKARELYERLLKLKPNSPEYYLRIADSQEKEGLYEQALETYRKAKEKLPKSKETRGRIISVLVGLERFDEAESEFEELIALYPGELDLEISYITFLNITAKYGKAKEIAEGILTESPTPTLLMQLSASYAGLKEYGKAAEYFEQAIKNMEEVSPADHLRLGFLYRRAGDEAKATKSFDKTIAMFQDELAADDENYMTLYNMGSIYELVGENEKAIEYYLKAANTAMKLLEEQEDNVSLMVQYADLMQKVERFDEAEKYYLLAIDREPQQATAMNNLGYMWIEHGEKLTKAIRLVEKALEIEPDNTAFLDSLGWGLFKRGKYREALEKLKTAVESGANDPVVFDHLGDAYLKNEMYEEAITNWGKALDLEHEDSESIEQKITETRNKLEN